MKPEYAVQIIHDGIDKDMGSQPFSNGSEAVVWFSSNCESCKKALSCYDPDKYESEICKDGGVSATLRGENCFGEYAVACGFITGHIAGDILIWMGGTETKAPEQCRFFSDDDNDRPDRRPAPVPPNQLFLPFLCASLFGFDDPNILVFDKAIVEKEIFEPCQT